MVAPSPPSLSEVFNSSKVHSAAALQAVSLPVRYQWPVEVASRKGLQPFVTGEASGTHTIVE